MALAIINKSILKVSGEKAHSLLDGLTTQDMNKISLDNPIYTLFLNNKGRVLFNSIIYKLAENEYALEIEPELLMELAKHLHKFDMEKSVEFGQEELAVAVSNEKLEGFYSDPRSEKLPYRGFIATDAKSDEEFLNEYENLRLELAIPDNNDFIREKSLANDLNTEELNGVSFTKGCYLGQEITSKTKHIRQTKNQLVCLDNTTLKAKNDQELFDLEDNKLGKTFSYNSKFVLAIIKRGSDTKNIKIK
tara:strand:+ start:2555 stop:3298 length:744 start_codon:yes stop_codon:yes gene_type:complete